MATSRPCDGAPAGLVRGGSYTVQVTVVPHSDEPFSLTVLPPDAALEAARPVPSGDELAIEGLTDDEWDAFLQALTER